MENLKQASGEIQARVRPLNFLGQSFALLLSFTIDILFRTAILWTLVDIRVSYNHCNISRVCLLVKMASKTLTRSIPACDVYVRLETTGAAIKIARWTTKNQ